MRGWITTDPLLTLAPGGLHGSAAAAVNPWMAPGGMLFVALDRGVECFAFSGELARRVHVGIQSVPGADGLTTDTAYSQAFACIALSRDGRMLAIGLKSSPYVAVYNTTTWRLYDAPATPPTGKVSSLAFSPDGSMLAVTHATSPFFSVYHTSDWSKLANPTTIPGTTGAGVGWSPDGSRLAVGSNSSPWLLVYDTSDWSVAYTATDLSAGVQVAAFAPNGTYLAVTTGTSPRVYTTATWESVVPSWTVSNRHCVWSPDSARLYTGSSGQITYTTPGAWGSTTVKTGLATGVNANAISPDGAMVAYTQSPYLGVLRVSDGAVLTIPPVFGTVIRAACWFSFPRP
jgi:WD40 repeat protein